MSKHGKCLPSPILGAALRWRKCPVDDDGGVTSLCRVHIRGADETDTGGVRRVAVPQQLDLEVELVETVLGTEEDIVEIMGKDLKMFYYLGAAGPVGLE